MGTGDERDALVRSRGLLLVDDFCSSTGLDRATVQALLRSDQVEGVFDGAGRAYGLFDDVLPTAERLRALGLPVQSDYDPESLRSYTDDTGDPGEPDDSGWSWETPAGGDRFVETLSSKQVYVDQWMAVREDTVRRRDGSTGIHTVMDCLDIALVVPAEDGRLHLVEQYRYPVAGRLWEFPSGSANPQLDADPAALASRELREETGLSAGRLRPLGTLDVTPSTMSQRCWVFLATELTHGEPQRDPEEQDMESAWFPRAHVERMITDGTITDAKTCAAYTLLLLHEQASNH